ncbi:MAG: hypothetical protein K9K37_07520 [Desulfocapsa sp.]|nr:hypothetical protein [Desulfocapsa sp.]
MKGKVIDDSFVAMLTKWNHTSGFNVDNTVRIASEDEKGITALAGPAHPPQPVLS